MPTLDNCINDLFTPGNIGASSGEPPVIPVLSTIIDPDDYDPDDLTYSHDFSKFYNAMYHRRGR